MSALADPDLHTGATDEGDPHWFTPLGYPDGSVPIVVNDVLVLNLPPGKATVHIERVGKIDYAVSYK